MNKPFSYLACLFLLMVSLSSCEKDEGTLNANYPVFFQHEFKNSAFGAEHAGWYIDRTGDVRYYNLPDNWKEPDSQGFISKEDLISNLELADSVLYELSIDILNDMIGFTDDIDESQLNDQSSQTTDAGIASSYYFIWDASVSKFKRILIWRRGDTSRINLDDQALELTGYLFSVGTEAGYFIQPG